MFNTKIFQLAYWPGLGKHVQVQVTFTYTYGGIVISVPKYFITDLASVPGVLRSVINTHGNHSPAAIVHDWLYACKGTIRLENKEEFRYTRKWADDVFLEALEVCGVGATKRYTMYSAVRAGGMFAWNS